MRQTTVSARSLTMGLAMAIAMLSPLSTSAQSALDASEAQAFMGEWVINMETDFGPFSMNLEVTDMGGKVAASMGAPEMGGMQSITNITKAGEALVMNWEIDAQGQMAPATMTIVLAGANLATILDIADGMFSAPGTGTKAGS